MFRSFFILTLAFITLVGCKNQSETSYNSAWDKVPEILAQIKEPVFPGQQFNILDYGAVADGKTLNSKAINDAIKACSEAGGGTVLVPKGDFYTGAIHFKSNVRLHLEENAILNFSVDPNDYIPLVYTRWEGIDCYNYSPLIYAYQVDNIALTGKGTIHGNASTENWWKWKGKKEYGWKEGEPSQLMLHARPMLDTLNKKQVPVEERIFGNGFYLRPQFVNFIECKNVLIQDITIRDSPFWILHPLFCENLIVRGVEVHSLGTNNDGCDPESCKNVLIEDCFFDTGDDCIALKSGRNTDGIVKNMPTENVIVRNCKMKNGHGGVVIGSEISGGAKNIFVENCEMDSPELDRAIRIKTNSNRSGLIDGIYVRNVTVGEVRESILRINLNYDIKKEGTDELYPKVQNVYLNNISCKKAKYALLINGIEGQDLVNNINYTNCVFEGVEKENVVEYAKGINFNNVSINGEVVNY